MSDDWYMMVISRRRKYLRKTLKPKNLWSTKRDTTSIPRSNPGFPRKLGITKNSQRFATPKKSRPPELIQSNLRKMKRCHSNKELFKGPVQSSNTKDSQSDAVYIYVLYSFTIVRLLVYPVPKPSRLVNCWISLKFTGKTIKNTCTLSQTLIP